MVAEKRLHLGADKFGPLEDHMADYAVDFLVDAAGSKHCYSSQTTFSNTSKLLALATTGPRPKGRRSRAKHPLTPPSPGGRAPDFAALETLADLDVEDGGLPSDLEDRFGSSDW